MAQYDVDDMNVKVQNTRAKVELKFKVFAFTFCQSEFLSFETENNFFFFCRIVKFNENTLIPFIAKIFEGFLDVLRIINHCHHFENTNNHSTNFWQTSSNFFNVINIVS
jgi:hypothetical protein